MAQLEQMPDGFSALELEGGCRDLRALGRAIYRGWTRAARSEPKRRRKTKPTKASKRRRVAGKRHRSQIKAHRRGGTEE